MGRSDKRVKWNFLTGFFGQIILIAIGFFLPFAYINNFGSDVNGVLQTVKQVFAYMCLIDAGVGMAATQALYKPVAQKDDNKTSSILSAAQNYYFKVGLIYGAVLLLLACFYGYIFPTGIDKWTLFIIITLTGVPNLFNFFVQSKYRILLEVDGRKYIINSSENISQIVANLVKLIVVLKAKDIVLMQTLYCLLTLMHSGFICVYAKRRYKNINMKSKPDFGAISQSKSAIVHQVSATVFNSTDAILISGICGSEYASVYTLYAMFFTNMQNLIISVVTSFSFALGQMFQVDREKFDKAYNAYEAVYIMSTFIIYTLMGIFLLPLIEICSNGANDVQYSNALLVFLFVLMNLLSNGKLPSNHVLEFSGKFEETRSHAVIEMIINIVVSVVAIKLYGICGAIVGTICALLYRGTMMIYYANKKVLGRSIFKTYKCWIINGAVFAALMLIFFVDTFSGVSFLKLLLMGIIHSLWIVPCYILVNFIFQREAFKTLLDLYRGNKKI